MRTLKKALPAVAITALIGGVIFYILSEREYKKLGEADVKTLENLDAFESERSRFQMFLLGFAVARRQRESHLIGSYHIQ